MSAELLNKAACRRYGLTRAIHHFGTTKARALLFTVTDGRVWMNPAIGELSFEQRQKAYDLLDRHCTTGKKAA